MEIGRADEIAFAEFLRIQRGVQLMSSGEPASLAAAALLGKALKRVGVHLCGLTVTSTALRIDDVNAQPELQAAEALLVVGEQLHVKPRPGVACFVVMPGEGEPLCARALRLAQSITHAGDASWLAAVGLARHALPHAIVEQALARHARADLLHVGDLLEAAARSHLPGMMSAMALELLIAAPEPRRFLDAEPCDLLRRCQTMIAVELARATRLRPRVGQGAVVIEYDSACRIEDLVATRWRGLRPGTAIVVANHGWVEGRVAMVARSAAPEALERLRPFLADGGAPEHGSALLTPAQWNALLATIGVAPLETVPTRPEITVEESADAPLMN